MIDKQKQREIFHDVCIMNNQISLMEGTSKRYVEIALKWQLKLSTMQEEVLKQYEDNIKYLKRKKAYLKFLLHKLYE